MRKKLTVVNGNLSTVWRQEERRLKTGTQCQVGQVWVVQSDIFNLKAGLQVTSHASRGWAPYIPAKTRQALARVTVLQRAVIRFFAWGASSSTGTQHLKLLIIRCSKIESWYLKLEWLTQIFKFTPTVTGSDQLEHCLNVWRAGKS